MDQAVSLVVAMKEFFGLQPGQSLMEFGQEVKKLSAEDKAEIKALLMAQGVAIKE